MIYQQFGKTGKKVSAVGFGGMRFDIGQSHQHNAELLMYAYEKGINYFDTAPRYCEDQSEDIFGLAMQRMRSVRDKIYVSTKSMPTDLPTAGQVRRAVEEQLKRLHLEKIDFYYVWCIRTLGHYELAMKKGGMYEGLLQCKQQGLIDHILVSTHLRGPDIGSVLSQGEFDGVLMGLNILNFPYRWEGVQKAYDMGLAVLAMNPLAGGAIPKYSDQLQFLARDNQTPTEAALNFCLSCPQITVALNGFTTKEHIDMACKVADNCRPFSDAQIAELEKHLAQSMNEICTGCGYCLKDCPENIPIASYLQYYNKKLLFNQSDQQMIEGLDMEQNWGILVGRPAGAGDCTECGNCENACTQHLNIIERLHEIAQWEEKVKQGAPKE